MSQTGQEALRLTAARVSSAVAYYAIMMATAAREEGSVKFFARLDVELMKAYDPRFSVPGRPPVSELLMEGAALQELLLCHERAPEIAEEGGVIGERMKDEDDVVAGALPFLAQPNPLEVWNHLGRVDVVDHPRWVELMVRAIEDSVRKGKLGNVEALAGQVMWHVRSKLQCPPVAAYPYEPKWDLEAAAAEYADVTLDPEEEPPKPDPTSLLDVNTAAEEEAWLAAREAVLMQARRRHAAATLLQRRLPLLLARLRAVREIRQLAMQWAPWMARLNTVLGLAKTYEGRCCVEVALHMQEPPEDSPDSPPLTNEEASEAETSKSAPAQKAAKGAPPKGKEAKASPPAGAATTPTAAPAAANAFAATASIPKAALMAVPLQALLHLARGVQLAVRGQAWHEALNAVGGVRI
ncbi:hypothetical protein DUNSADRAFT_3069 [Dunaliella salina]|uniref:Uncharacterized protein n=1 Tax=Dunaliella salina TaxID=3046 RepID=A0ABQ7FVN2_DUNSA|nr:hypothetical protein DUNSADRAFT_3069 [Dunaliella salina]|eukprot:KAF5826443.1 hypothetical protein DUNSADRAFT_3069 [Dunaliella salina]